MLTFDEKAFIDFKLSIAKDLEKKIKMGYQSQFRNIVISITSMPKRYKKIKAPLNVAEDMQKLENLSRSMYNYLVDMFDVFGDNAVLNAKRIFEDNGVKWGRKFYKSFKEQYNSADAKKLVKELYLSLADIDYMTLSNRQLYWSFLQPKDDSGISGNSCRYFSALYDVKAIWLQHFIKGIAPGYVGILEIVESSEDKIVTNIIIKEGL